MAPKICSLSQAFAGLDQWIAQTELGDSGNDDYDKFSLPTGPRFIEDILEFGACCLISDAQFDGRGPEVFLLQRAGVPIWPRLESSQSETAADRWARS
jgi:hypothetical protein